MGRKGQDQEQQGGGGGGRNKQGRNKRGEGRAGEGRADDDREAIGTLYGLLELIRMLRRLVEVIVFCQCNSFTSISTCIEYQTVGIRAGDLAMHVQH